ncbi:MAG TPA: hypothetical protein VMW16_06735 [Sedimentisphaerales bacterium]|nr:hypothetical protein [Sedimentisphaerales bacterium]
MSRTLSMLIAVVFLFGLLIVFRKHIADNSRLEYSGRVSCIRNLREIAKALGDKNIHLKEEDIPAIEAVIEQLNRQCPSGKRVHSDKGASSYQVIVLPGGHVVVTEHPDRLEFVGKVAEPRVRKKYIGKSVRRYVRKSQNPIHYVNCR